MTDHRIMPFLFEGEGLVRIVDQEGQPWFVALDICRSIGIRDVSDAVEKLDEDEKGRALIPTLGGEQEALVISEGGLYTLILRSRDATKQGTVAHRFRKWITGEVLPTIRQTGRYEHRSYHPDLPEAEAQTPDTLKLSKVRLVLAIYGERAAAQLYQKLGLEMVPAMAGVFAQADMFGDDVPGTGPGKITPSPQGPPH